uniref:Uncharacterized protein n=1 Tax=Panagrolaimus davidi TaxID=227884 RepID=A0A914QID7_9BILA
MLSWPENNCSEKDVGFKKWQKQSASASKSTFSIHVAAYENLNEVLCDFVNGTKHNFASLIESRGNAKQIFNNFSFIQNPFEFPRQQEEDRSPNPEVMQFKASQQLLNVEQKEKQDYAALVKLCQTEKSAEFLKIHSFDLLETLIYAFMDNKDKLLIRCMKVLNVFVTPKERLLTYLTTIDNINSLTLCIHFARNTYKDIPDLPEK